MPTHELKLITKDKIKIIEKKKKKVGYAPWTPGSTSYVGKVCFNNSVLYTNLRAKWLLSYKVNKIKNAQLQNDRYWLMVYEK